MASFKGALETTDGTSAPARLAIDETTLSLEVGGSPLGSWGFDAVEVRRSAGNRFIVDVADERLIFIADSPVDFAYTVPGWVEAHKPKRRWGTRRRLEARKANPVDRTKKPSTRRHLEQPKAQPVNRMKKSGTRQRLEQPKAQSVDRIKKSGTRQRLEQRKAQLVDRIEKSGGRRRAKVTARKAEHVHTWSEQSLPGGLIRRVCQECDHVSIDLREADLPEDVTPEWETQPKA